MDERLSDIFAQCLARVDAGASVDDCLAAYPQERAALEGPLRLAARLRALPHPAPLPPGARAAMATQVLGQVAAQRSATTGSVRTPTQSTPRGFDPSAMLARALRSLGYRGPLSPVWLRLASVTIGLILALVLTTGALAAARAIVRVMAPAQPTTAPASTAPTLIPAETFALDGPIEQVSPESWLVNGLPVMIDARTSISGTPQVGAVAHVRGTLQDNGALLASNITVDTVLADTSPVAGAPTAAPAAPTPTIAPAPAAPAPTVIAEPPVPTVAPELPAAPAASGDLFAQLRALLVAGVADGRGGQNGKELVKKFDEGQAAFVSGDLKKTAEKLRELRQKVDEKTREEKMDSNFSGQALALIDAIANTYSLNVASDDKGKDDKGKDDKGKDK